MKSDLRGREPLRRRRPFYSGDASAPVLFSMTKHDGDEPTSRLYNSRARQILVGAPYKQGHDMTELQRASTWSGPTPRRIESAEKAYQEDRLRVEHSRKMLQKAKAVSGAVSDAWWQRHANDQLPPPPLDIRRVKTLIRCLDAGLGSDFAHPSLASAIYFRGVRAEVLGNLLRAIRRFRDDDLVTFTAINCNWRYAPDELGTVSAATLKAQFQSHLKQVGITTMPGPLVAFLHGEFEPSSGLYQLHFHGITTTEKALALGQLKKRFGYDKTATGARPIVCQTVKDRLTQITYLLKSYWPERTVRIVDGKPKRDRKPRRIKEPFHTQVLLWLDSQRLIELTVMNNCWSPRLGGSRAMHRFYLSVTRR